MARSKLPEGKKKKQFYYLIEQQYYNIFGKNKLNEIITKAVNKEIDALKKGKIPNQICLLEQIEEIKKEKK